MVIQPMVIFITILFVIFQLWVIIHLLKSNNELRERPTYVPRYMVTDLPVRQPPRDRGWIYVCFLIIFILLGTMAYWYIRQPPPGVRPEIVRAGASGAVEEEPEQPVVRQYDPAESIFDFD